MMQVELELPYDDYWIKGGGLSSPPMSNSSSFIFESIQHMRRNDIFEMGHMLQSVISP